LNICKKIRSKTATYYQHLKQILRSLRINSIIIIANDKIIMYRGRFALGKGDKRTKRGKIRRGSFGKTRPKKKGLTKKKYNKTLKAK